MTPPGNAAGTLLVVDGGLLTTVQDLGRHGYERYGVPVAGAADRFALRAANLLVGNPADAAAIEITLVGPQLQAGSDCLIAVAGGDLGLRVHDWELSSGSAVLVRRGWMISFGTRRSGCRAVLAVSGGIAVPHVLGSRSTYLPGRFGGYEGRALRAGDLLPLGPAAVDPFQEAGRALAPQCLPPYCDAPTVHVVLGPQDDHFSPAGLATFLSSEYSVSSTSDRMGCRLDGPAILHRGPAEIISDGVPLGAVQVPPDGRPIVLLADRQTSGGYPKIATVISADIPLLAQCVPGQSRIRFAAVSMADAQAAYRRQMQGLYALSSVSAGDTQGTWG